jgi:hypothetical protein
MVKNTKNQKRKKAAAKKPVVSPAVIKSPVKKTGSFNKVYSSPKQGFRHKLREWIRQHNLLTIFIIVMLAGGLIIGYERIKIYQEKQQFNQAEAALDELANQIADDLGKPLESKKGKGCSYSSVKYGKGDLGCSISYVMEKPVSSAAEANGYSKSIESLVKEDFQVTYESNLPFKDGSTSRPSTDNIYAFVSDKLYFELSIKYFDPKDDSNNYVEDHKMTIVFYHRNDARAEHYPVID